ncbi:hypothetical protein MZB18_03750 [Haemophilus influenzae]|nr:hypothetical protein [Haemophilus influenzae]
MNIDVFITKTRKFYKELQEHTASRYRSWEYCYTQFYEARQNPEKANVDNLSLHLAFYLASWGMYRGSSFLLQYDYTIHTSVVKEILKSEYSTLFGLECKELNNEQTSSLLNKLNSEISTIYNPFRLELKETKVTQDISNILVSKVLLGTLGCVPAYDRFFVDAVKKNEVTTGNYNITSLQKLIKFYEENQKKLEKLRSEFLIKYEFDGEEKTLDYPQMKLLDIGFWKIGFDLSEEAE